MNKANIQEVGTDFETVNVNMVKTNDTSLSWNHQISISRPFELIKICNRYNLVIKGDILLFLL